MKIESEDIDIESLFAGRFFSIPRFQRPYSWDDDNIQDLWDDVMSSSGEDYFIGSMVVFREGKQEYSVVDGQQRLTTITLLLCAIRDAFMSADERDLAEGLHQLIERKDRSNRSAYVLRTETSFPFLQENILKFGEPELLDITELAEEEALRRANATLKKKVSDLLEAVDIDSSIPESEKTREKVERLISVRESVLNSKVILVKLENEDDAYLIFETLNTRGKDLSVADLFKNHFTKHLKAKGDVDAVKVKWTSILEMIHESSVDLSPDAFLYHFWASRHEAVPLKKLYATMKKKVDKKNARIYLDDLVRDSKLYRSVHEPSYNWDVNERRVARSLSAIQLFRVVQPTPALLSLVRAYRDKRIKLRKLAEAVEAIENFHFTFTAITSSRSSGGISGMYSSFARKLYEAADSQEACNEIRTLVQKLRDRRPILAEFELGFTEVTYTNSFTKKKDLVRYILRKFSEHNGDKFAVDWDELTIEHIQPQASIGSGDWTEEEVGQLGNLFLLDARANTGLGDKLPLVKRDWLVDGGYSVPAELELASDWTRDQVACRTRSMAKTGHESIWKI